MVDSRCKSSTMVHKEEDSFMCLDSLCTFIDLFVFEILKNTNFFIFFLFNHNCSLSLNHMHLVLWV